MFILGLIESSLLTVSSHIVCR